MSEKAKENFIKLTELSRQADEIRERLLLTDYSINDIIIKFFYTKTDKSLKFNTFMGWMSEGYKVKKGEKGYLIWSRPKKKIDKEKNENAESKENDHRKYFISYIFSNKQVELIKGQ